ncbi:hypothetical protein [Kitasatospora sp. NPDC085879]|uniref:hypothetical protein n=1 Tax=Kitasatospora sp. NPDC085879 TaxID=3154769 RepID=UPI000BB0FD40|nr:hypothetical protein [Streptomyces sp. TLI_235]PBC76911.1 hypothetical protein BX265_1632 [Streptomyces sp. TLI_235]
MSRHTTALRAATAVSAAVLALGALTACDPAEPSAAPSAAAPSPAAPSAADTTPAAGDAASPAASPGTKSGGATGPAVGGIPASAWMKGADLPLNAAYHWPAQAGKAKAVKNGEPFAFETLCDSARSQDLTGLGTGSDGAQSLLSGGTDEWQVQQTVVHFKGTSSGAVQSAGALLRGLTEEVKACAPDGATPSVKVTAEDPAYLAATITLKQGSGGITVHEYLTTTSTTVAELTVYGPYGTKKPKAAWTVKDDTAVLRLLGAPLCDAFKNC